MADKDFLVGVRDKEDAIYFLRIKANSVNLEGEKESTYWHISGDSAEMWISKEAFVLAAPREMFTKEP